MTLESCLNNSNSKKKKKKKLLMRKRSQYGQMKGRRAWEGQVGLSSAYEGCEHFQKHM